MPFDVEEVLKQLNTKEKIAIISGADHWHTVAVPRLNVPAIRTSDGPNGIRGQFHFNSTPTACLPVGTALGSTWDRDLVNELGILLQEEARVKGAHVILAPTVNIQRIPNGGRGFESFSEDPVLSGELAASYIQGVQSTGVAATIKHFIGNDQENERFSSNSIISQRALREIYLKPFEIAIEKANPRAVMSSYNRVNGTHVSENPKFLNGLLREEWGWDGLIMSDWTGVYSTSESINAGLDLEMPGPGKFRSESALLHSLLAKTITEETLDERVRNVLNLVKDMQTTGIPEGMKEGIRDFVEDRSLLRQAAAESVVVLKNHQGTLPLQKHKTTLVIGPNASYAAYSGGGSALATPYYSISPLAAIKEKIGSENVQFEIGAYNHRYTPSLQSELWYDGKHATKMEIFHTVEKTIPFDSVILPDINYFRMNDYVHPELHSPYFYATLTSTFIPNHTGIYEFGLAVYGTAKLYINDELVVDNATNQVLGESFYGCGTPEIKSTFHVVAHQEYSFRIDFGSAMTSVLCNNGSFFGGGGLRCGGYLLLDHKDALNAAVAAAITADQVVIITGLNHDYESEGADRSDLHIPGWSNKLISEVLKVNSNAVVVVQSGTPVEMPWEQKAKTIVWGSFGGDEVGNGLADVLFGDVNACGKLPLTFPVKFEDTPSFVNNTTHQGRVLYGEDVFVGYRYFEKAKRKAQWEFGHGLSYTKFKLSDLEACVSEDELSVSLNAENIGVRDGKVVIQVYIAPKDANFRPIKELKEFGKKMICVGETAKFDFRLPIDLSTSLFDEEIEKWVSLAGEYEVVVGQSSCDNESLRAGFEVKKTKKYLRRLVIVK